MIDNLLDWLNFRINKPKYPVYKRPGGYRAWKDRKAPKTPGSGALITCGLLLIMACGLCFSSSTGLAYYAGKRGENVQLTQTAVAILAETTSEITPETTQEMITTSQASDTPIPTNTADIVVITTNTPTPTHTPDMTTEIYTPIGWPMTQTVSAWRLLPTFTLTPTQPATLTPTAPIINRYAGGSTNQQIIYITAIPPAPIVIRETAIPERVIIEREIVVTATPTPTETAMTPEVTSEITPEITPEITEQPTITPDHTVITVTHTATETPAASNTPTNEPESTQGV